MRMLPIHRKYVLVRTVNKFCVLIHLVVCIKVMKCIYFGPIQSHIERVAQDNTKLVRYTSIHIEYKNIVFAFYNFSIPVVVE